MSRIVKWIDETGRQQASLLPDHAPDSDAPIGVPMLTVDIDELGLPEPFATKLHNQLVARGLWDWPAVMRKGGREALMSALLGVLKGALVELTDLYRRVEK